MKIKIGVLVGLCGLAVVTIADVYAQSGGTTIRTQKGLRFTVPEDWPIEERNGVVAPIPIEEYVTQKFQEIDERFAGIRSALTAKIDDLGGRIEAKDAEWSEKLDEVSSVVGSLQEDIRTFTLELNKLSGMQPRAESVDRDTDSRLDRLDSRLNTLERQLRSLEFHLTTLEERESGR